MSLPVAPVGTLDLNRTARTFLLITIALVAALAAIYLFLPVLSSMVRVPLAYTEGWNAYHAARAVGEARLYPSEPVWINQNYPPLSFYINGLLGNAIGDHLLAARYVSLAALVACALFLAIIGRRLSGGWLPGVFSGVLFLCLIGALFTEYVGIADPQFLAHAFSAAGLALFVWRRSDGWPLALAAVLMVLGGLVKQVVLPIPLAVFLWLAIYDRVAAVRFAVYGAASALLAVAVCYLLWGGDFFESMLSARVYSTTTLAVRGVHWLAMLAMPLLFWLVLLFGSRRDPAAVFVHLYVVLSVALGVFIGGGAGVGINAGFDATLALSLAAGLAMARLDLSTPMAPSLPPAVSKPVMGLVLVSTTFMHLSTLSYDLMAVKNGDLAAWDEATEADLALLRASDGDAICETLSLCYWAGQPLVVDPYGSRQFFALGVADEAELLEALKRGDIRSLQLERLARTQWDERFSPAFMDTVNAHFRQVRNSRNGYFFVYNQPEPPGPADQPLTTSGEPDASSLLPPAHAPTDS